MRADEQLRLGLDQLVDEWMTAEHVLQIDRRKASDAEGLSDLYDGNGDCFLLCLENLDDAMGELSANLPIPDGLCYLVGQAFSDMIYAPPTAWSKSGDLEGLIARMLPRMQHLISKLSSTLVHFERIEFDLLSLRPTHLSVRNAYSVFEKIVCVQNEVSQCISNGAGVTVDFVSGYLGVQYVEENGDLMIWRNKCASRVLITRPLHRELFRIIIRADTEYYDEQLFGAWPRAGNAETSDRGRLDTEVSELNKHLGRVGLKIKKRRNGGRRLFDISIATNEPTDAI